MIVNSHLFSISSGGQFEKKFPHRSILFHSYLFPSSTPGKGGLFFEMMTPILMAAQKNDHEAYELLTDLGHSTPVSWVTPIVASWVIPF